MARRKTLLESTHALLAKDKRNLMQLAKDTDLGYHWLHKFRSGRVRNPGILHVQALHDALSK